MQYNSNNKPPILAVAQKLGLSLKGEQTSCWNAQQHSGGVDRNPSLKLYPATNSYHCFACKIRGDVFNMIMDHLQISFSRSIEWANSQDFSKQSTVATTTNGPISTATDSRSLEVYSKMWELTIPPDPTTSCGQYLANRGLDLTLAERYGVRFCPRGDLFTRLQHHFSLEEIKNAGITSKSGQYLFQNHPLLFFHLIDGRPHYLRGRSISPSASVKELGLTGRSCPAPFNADLLKQADEVWICEGVIDTLSAIKLGLPAVGVPGVHGFRDAWFNRFSNFPKVVIAFDNDQPGQEAAMKLRGEFRLRGFQCEVKIPNDRFKDINDILVSQLQASVVIGG